MYFGRNVSRLAWIAVLVACATHAADPMQGLASTDTQTASRIAGSLMQSTGPSVASPRYAAQQVSAAVHALADEPGDADDIKAVCLTNGSNLARCGAATAAGSAKASGCHEGGGYDPEAGTVIEPSSWCHGRTQSTLLHASHVAVCDVDDVGLERCLEKYASSLVNHPAAAKRVYQFAGANNAVRPVTVLATTKQSARDALQMAARDIKSASVIDNH